jgi:uncharacterized radical SAM superfamily Fe-S cluster-containing enzyme
MEPKTIQDFIERALLLKEKCLTIDLDTRLEKKLLKETLLGIFQYEGMIDFHVNRIPMCFIGDFFYHMDNEPSQKKVKCPECFSCALNYFCKGFLPEMAGFAKGIKDMPKEIVIEVTDKCNLQCKMCFNQQEYNLSCRNTRMEMSTQEIMGVISKIKGMGIEIVRFSGGEPLLREDLLPIAKFARGLGLRVWLNTNATLACSKGVPKNLFENVLVSLNGFDEKSELNVTGGSFERKIEGIRLLRKVKVLRGGVVLTSMNIKNIERFYKLA